MAAFAPIPSPSVKMTVIASPFVRHSDRSATLRSCRIKSGFTIIIESSEPHWLCRFIWGVQSPGQNPHRLSHCLSVA